MTASDSRHWTVDDHRRGQPAEVVALFDRFLAAVQACGPLEVQRRERQIVLQGRRRIVLGRWPGDRHMPCTIYDCWQAARHRRLFGHYPDGDC